jgi:hypothetical protein
MVTKVRRRKQLLTNKESCAFSSNYSERHALNNNTKNIELMVQFYAEREYVVVMRLIAYIEDYEPHLLNKARETLEDYRRQDDQLLLDISRGKAKWEELRMNEALEAAAGGTENDTLALGVPNSAGGEARGVAEDSTSAMFLPNSAGGAAEDNTSVSGLLSFPNLAGGEAGGVAEDSTSAMCLPNSAGGAADSARTGRRLGLTDAPLHSSRNVATMPSGPDAFSNIVKNAKTSAAKRNNQDMSD